MCSVTLPVRPLIESYYNIIQFVCLFVRDSRLNYAKDSHQSFGNYRDPPGRTTPRFGVTRPVVSMAFPVYFRYSPRNTRFYGKKTKGPF